MEAQMKIAAAKRVDRRKFVAMLLDRIPDALVISGLGSPTYDVFAAGDRDRNFYLWGAMGAASMVGLGLALARPERRVLVATGDGEMLMGLGSLATIGAERPPNLAVAVFDNGRYGETGMQESHTDCGISLAGVARACGIEQVCDVADEAGLRDFAARLAGFESTLFARIAIAADDKPRVLPSRDGALLKTRFRTALGAG